MKRHPATISHEILLKAFAKKASDIHFYPFANKEIVHVFFRIHGERIHQQTISKPIYQLLLTYFKFTAKMDIGEIRRPQDGVMLEQSGGVDYYLRLSTLPIADTESLTIRLLPQKENLLQEELFLFPKQFKRMKSWLKKKSGIILVTGPTGSGKSTTMYALIESMITKRSAQIITLEDPIERQIDEIIQVEINEKAGISYQSGLKAALRHDPDILLIGEIRDEATAKFAFRAALTGHLVISTLHAKDGVGTIDRLIDLGVSRVDISQSLFAVAAIQLLPIIKNDKVIQRAAIVELLDDIYLKHIILGESNLMINHNHSFDQLKEKAYLYGFISKETFEDRSK